MKLSAHHSNSLTKLLLIGDAKSGKTGSLVSLVRAGYKLRIIDTDNLLDILKYMILAECPDKIDNVEVRSLRDKRKATASGWEVSKADTFINVVKMLQHWRYTDDDGTEVDLGNPAEWGPDCILVLDSLSRTADAAYDWRISMSPPNFDGRAIFGDAQDALESVLSGLTAPSFRTNVIVIGHVQYMDMEDGKKKGFPQGIGKALSPKIPQYFPSMVLYTNDRGKRTIQTATTNLMDLANPRPLSMQKSYPIETGLAEFFRVLQDPPKEGVTRELAPIETKPANTTPLLRKA